MEDNRKLLLHKSKLSEEEFDEFVSLLEENIHDMSTKSFSNKLKEAKEISPHIKDTLYIALSLKLNCGIWSGDKGLKRQSKVLYICTLFTLFNKICGGN